MATLRDIKRRITGVKNTQQITKAMKMVAAARLRRAQENIINARPYSRKIAEVLSDLLHIEKNIENKLFEKRDPQKVAIVVLTSDRGLCGSFNMNSMRTAENLAREDYLSIEKSGNLYFYTLGKKGKDYLSKRFDNVVIDYTDIFHTLTYDNAVKIVNVLKSKFIIGELDKVVLVYNEFKSVVQQEIKIKQLLPIIPPAKGVSNSADENVGSEYIYEPDKKTIIETLIPRYLNVQLWSALLESYAAELGARMTAMDMATENAKDLIRDLQILYNKERQASITTEILEIVSGANALKES